MSDVADGMDMEGRTIRDMKLLLDRDCKDVYGSISLFDVAFAW